MTVPETPGRAEGNKKSGGAPAFFVPPGCLGASAAYHRALEERRARESVEPFPSARR